MVCNQNPTAGDVMIIFKYLKSLSINILIVLICVLAISCTPVGDDEETIVSDFTASDLGSPTGRSVSITKTGSYNYVMALTPYEKGFKIRFSPAPRGLTSCTGTVYQSSQSYNYTGAVNYDIYAAYSSIYSGYFTRSHESCFRIFDDWMDLNIISSKTGFDPNTSYRVCHVDADCFDVTF